MTPAAIAPMDQLRALALERGRDALGETERILGKRRAAFSDVAADADRIAAKLRDPELPAPRASKLRRELVELRNMRTRARADVLQVEGRRDALRRALTAVTVASTPQALDGAEMTLRALLDVPALRGLRR